MRKRVFNNAMAQSGIQGLKDELEALKNQQKDQYNQGSLCKQKSMRRLSHMRGGLLRRSP